MKRTIIAAAIAISSLSGAQAGLVPQPYTEYARNLIRAFEEIEAANELSPPEKNSAENMATTWFYMGPCEGKNVPHDMEAAQLVAGAEVYYGKLGSAVLEMITILSRDSIGRKPREETCRFAKEMAESTSPR